LLKTVKILFELVSYLIKTFSCPVSGAMPVFKKGIFHACSAVVCQPHYLMRHTIWQFYVLNLQYYYRHCDILLCEATFLNLSCILLVFSTSWYQCIHCLLQNLPFLGKKDMTLKQVYSYICAAYRMRFCGL